MTELLFALGYRAGQEDMQRRAVADADRLAAAATGDWQGGYGQACRRIADRLRHLPVKGEPACTRSL